MPIGPSVSVLARLCVVFSSSNSQCSDVATPVLPEPGFPDYRTQVTVTPCAVGEAPTLSVSAAADDWSAAWTLRDENGDITTDYGLMRTAEVTVTFAGALSGLDPWTSETTTCSGAPEPEPEPSVSPTP
jgi:hypothetical protein